MFGRRCGTVAGWTVRHSTTPRLKTLRASRIPLKWIIVPPIWVKIKTGNNSPNCQQGWTRFTLPILYRVQSIIWAVPIRIRVHRSANRRATSFRANPPKILRTTPQIVIVRRASSKSTQQVVENLFQLPLPKLLKMDQVKQKRKKRMRWWTTTSSTRMLHCPFWRMSNKNWSIKNFRRSYKVFMLKLTRTLCWGGQPGTFQRSAVLAKFYEIKWSKTSGTIVPNGNQKPMQPLVTARSHE